MAWRSRFLAGLALTAVLVMSVPVAFAAPTPRLTTAAVRKIAMRAAAPYLNRSPNTWVPFAPLQVERIQVGHIGKRIVWLAHMHATQFIFGCKPGIEVPPSTHCGIPGFTPYALVTIADDTGDVLSTKFATS